MKRMYSRICAVILLGVVLESCNRSPEALRDKYVAAGKQLLQKKDYARAILQFRNATQTMPKDAEAYYQLGLAYLGARNWRPAYLALRKAIELNPKHSAAQIKL